MRDINVHTVHKIFGIRPWRWIGFDPLPHIKLASLAHLHKTIYPPVNAWTPEILSSTSNHPRDAWMSFVQIEKTLLAQRSRRNDPESTIYYPVLHRVLWLQLGVKKNLICYVHGSSIHNELLPSVEAHRWSKLEECRNSSRVLISMRFTRGTEAAASGLGRRDKVSAANIVSPLEFIIY